MMIKASTQGIPMGLAMGINDYGILEAGLDNEVMYRNSNFLIVRGKAQIISSTQHIKIHNFLESIFQSHLPNFL